MNKQREQIAPCTRDWASCESKFQLVRAAQFPQSLIPAGGTHSGRGLVETRVNVNDLLKTNELWCCNLCFFVC